MAITLSILKLVDLQNSFTAAKSTKLLLHYLGKLKNQKFCILVHVKHISNVTFYHLSNRCLPNAMKINAAEFLDSRIPLYIYQYLDHRVIATWFTCDT